MSHSVDHLPPHERARERDALGSERGTRLSVRETLRSLDIAARSILESQAIAGTVASLIAERALDHHWEGLFQYAAIRVGYDHAAKLLAQLEQEVEASSREKLDEAPHGPGAFVYARMRALLAGAPVLPHGPEAPLWWTPSDPSFRRGLIELRRALGRERGEIAELRFARRLTCAEAAAVLDADAKDIERASDESLELAERWLGKRPASRDHTLEGALLEAFTLDPRYARAPRRRGRRPVLEMGTRIADRYEVEGLLGAGAFADVYRARDRDVTDHVVALKILRAPAADPQSVHTALRELQLIASVFHPSVVQLKDHGWHNGHLWFVMPLYRGETLSMRLRRGPLTRREARRIFEPLAEALATMHRAGVLHQDIKPDNVFLANLDPEVASNAAPRRILPVLLDLGVAAKDAELVLAGTPAYFAPEVAARFANAPDPPPVGPKADVFSLALTLRHALDPEATEEFAGAPVDAFVELRATRAPKAPLRRDLRDLRPFFERCLHFSPDGRPTAEEFHRQLRVLTALEERRAQRLALMRWAVPTVVAVLALFGSIVYGLSREAAMQRLEATQAQARFERARDSAASMSARLNVQQARRMELEADVARLEREYQNSKMTREQLATHLAQAEGQLDEFAERQAQQLQRLRMQADELREQKDQLGSLQKELSAAVARRDELGVRLERSQDNLAGERSRREELDAEASRLRDELAAQSSALKSAQARVLELETRVGVLRQLLSGPSAPFGGAALPRTTASKAE
ncbi:MAG TPA: protein kinase [Polyangiales bacterium]|nr:protein kinase [Polyangiales bacterium]